MFKHTAAECSMAYCVGFAISTGPGGQQHGVAYSSSLILCCISALLPAQQVLPASPELLLTDAARLLHQLSKQCIEISATSSLQHPIMMTCHNITQFVQHLTPKVTWLIHWRDRSTFVKKTCQCQRWAVRFVHDAAVDGVAHGGSR